MAEYTPSEGDARAAYRQGMKHVPGTDYDETSAEFDRFLARVRRDAARSALDGLAADELARVASLGKHSYPAQIAQGIAQAAWNYKWKNYGGAHPETEDQT